MSAPHTPTPSEVAQAAGLEGQQTPGIHGVGATSPILGGVHAPGEDPPAFVDPLEVHMQEGGPSPPPGYPHSGFGFGYGPQSEAGHANDQMQQMLQNMLEQQQQMQQRLVAMEKARLDLERNEVLRKQRERDENKAEKREKKTEDEQKQIEKKYVGIHV